MKYTANDIKKLGTILGLWAHPDDESWCMGGIMAIASQNGQRVVCVTATKGDAGQTADETKWPQARLGEIRTEELQKALQTLGVNEHTWLDYQDGQLPDVETTHAVERLSSIIKKVRPDTIFSFGPDGLTGHDDHRTMYEWTKRAIISSGIDTNFFHTVEITERYETVGRSANDKFNIYFNLDEPVTFSSTEIDLYIELPQDVLDKKIESLRVQECQTSVMFKDPLGFKYVQESCSCEAFMKVKV